MITIIIAILFAWSITTFLMIRRNRRINNRIKFLSEMAN